ncbi:MAG: hypothetical protein LBD09_02215, partial [Treponema sp.]|nr:hypothetical protein [Treponema sp.]
MKKAVPLRGLLPALIFLALIFACKNPMVNYLLGEKEEEEDPSPVAYYDPPGPSAGVWYHSLAEALDAAAAVPDTSPVIQIRRDIKTQKTLGASSFTLPYKT